jgi:hypothetical protein
MSSTQPTSTNICLWSKPNYSKPGFAWPVCSTKSGPESGHESAQENPIFTEREIDFVGERNGQRSYFQASYLLSDNATVEREFTPLEKIPDNYPKYVLSLDNFSERDRNGITWKNLIEFLLEE